MSPEQDSVLLLGTDFISDDANLLKHYNCYLYTHVSAIFNLFLFPSSTKHTFPVFPLSH